MFEHDTDELHGANETPWTRPLERGLPADEVLARLRECFQEIEARSVAAYDELMALLTEARKPLQEVVAAPGLPAGRRMPLIELLADALGSALSGLAHETSVEPGAPDVHLRVLDRLTDLYSRALEERVQARAGELASELTDVGEELDELDRFIDENYHQLMNHKPLPSDEEIRAWLRRALKAKRRGR